MSKLVNLKAAQFWPLCFLVSLIFFLPVFLLTLLIIFNFKIEIIMILFFFMIAYLTTILLIFIDSQSKKAYAIFYDKHVEARCIGSTDILTLDYKHIIEIDYYSSTSFKAWFVLFNYVVPNCVYITFVTKGGKNCRLLGYMNSADIAQISKELQLKITVH